MAGPAPGHGGVTGLRPYRGSGGMNHENLLSVLVKNRLHMYLVTGSGPAASSWVIDSRWVTTQWIPGLGRRIVMTCSCSLEPDI
jgi:hypothetical protein